MDTPKPKRNRRGRGGPRCQREGCTQLSVGITEEQWFAIKGG